MENFGKQFIYTNVKMLDRRYQAHMTFIYRSPKYYKHDHLWLTLDNMAVDIQGPWILLGDFNAYANLVVNLGGGGALNWSSMK